MKKSQGLLIAGMLAMTAIPAWLTASAGEDGGVGGVQYDRVAPDGRVLTEQEILELLQRSGQATTNIDPNNVEVEYQATGNTIAAETNICCENVEEVVTETVEVQETTTYMDEITEREIIQPIERTLIQPVERQILQGRTETVTEETRFEEEVLPLQVQQDDVPAVQEVIIPQETFETRETVTETFEDVVSQRDVIQPVVRTTVVPVKRRVIRPQVENITGETRYETRTAPLRVEADTVPPLNEYTTEQVNTVTREEVTETVIDAVTRRDVIQPVERTVVQPIERRILQPQTETVTAPVRYEEEVLPVRVDRGPRPQMVENVIPQYIEKTVLEVEDIYIDQVTRNVTQPVVITTIQPVERRILRGRKDTVTAPVRYEEQFLAGRVEAVQIPQTQVNYIPQVNETTRNDFRESYFEAVTRREVIQPVVRTQVQPVQIVRYTPRTETITAPTQYETIRASAVTVNVGAAECVCVPVGY